MGSNRRLLRRRFRFDSDEVSSELFRPFLPSLDTLFTLVLDPSLTTFFHLSISRYLRLRKQGGAVTWRQVFSTQRSYSRSLRTSSQRNFTYPRSRPTAGSASNFDSAGYPLPADMFLPTLPERAARVEGRRGAQGATIGSGGRRDVGEEEEEAGNELPAYESARKTGLPDYQFEDAQLSYPLSSSPPPLPPPSLPLALGAVAASSTPPPPSLLSSSPSPAPPSQDSPRPPSPSPDTDLDAEEEERRLRRG